jgi:hypothetical protein
VKAASVVWGTGLLVLSLGWAALITTAMGESANLGVSIGMGGPLFAFTGIIAAIVYAITKSAKKAMWVWTILLLISFAILGVGGIKVMSAR